MNNSSKNQLEPPVDEEGVKLLDGKFMEPSLPRQPLQVVVPIPPLVNPSATKKCTPKAASQFKSPLSGPSLAKSATLSSVRLTPTIQALERKVQILKRAVKVKMNGEEEELNILAKKWGDAGRDVAWELWELVKDSGSEKSRQGNGGWGQEISRGTKRSMDEGWGWDDRDSKRMKTEAGGRDWSWSVERSKDENGNDEIIGGQSKMREGEDCEEEHGQDTLGTMLRQLGIAPETLGWNEDEGDFMM